MAPPLGPHHDAADAAFDPLMTIYKDGGHHVAFLWMLRATPFCMHGARSRPIPAFVPPAHTSYRACAIPKSPNPHTDLVFPLPIGAIRPPSRVFGAPGAFNPSLSVCDAHADYFAKIFFAPRGGRKPHTPHLDNFNSGALTNSFATDMRRPPTQAST